MNFKSHRQLAIRKILTNGSIQSQEGLLSALKQEGFDLTQATLSRDLKNLGVAKVHDPQKGYKYVFPGTDNSVLIPETNQINTLADGFRGIDFSGNIAVIKTLPGYASSIASMIDNAKQDKLIGTIAGDDTILAVMKEDSPRSDIINTLIKIMPNLKNKIG
jgi:transcriptional regulator of arginine metabolism